MANNSVLPMSKRDLLALIGRSGGASAMCLAMGSLGQAHTTPFKGLHGMPAVGRMMTDQQVADVVNYVRTHFGNKYKDSVTAAQVKAAR